MIKYIPTTQTTSDRDFSIYQMYCYHNMNFRQIGEHFGFSQVRARQLFQRELRRRRETMRKLEVKRKWQYERTCTH
jgi:DNA-directed RNA polymerase specialized sigma subunit